jgi:hypothetical protein
MFKPANQNLENVLSSIYSKSPTQILLHLSGQTNRSHYLGSYILKYSCLSEILEVFEFMSPGRYRETVNCCAGVKLKVH